MQGDNGYKLYTRQRVSAVKRHDAIALGPSTMLYCLVSPATENFPIATAAS